MIKTVKTHLVDISNGKNEINVENVNIFVGPNSSGKSLILNELKNHLTSQNYDYENTRERIVNEIEFTPVPLERQIELLNSLGNTLNENTYTSDSLELIKLKDGQQLVSIIYNDFNLGNTNRKRLEYYEKDHTLFLDGASRLKLLQSTNFSPYSQKLDSVYAIIYHNPEIYNDFRNYINEAFGFHTYFKIDGPNIQFVFSRIPAPDDFDEFSLRNESVEFLKTCLTNDDLSDGQKSYIGILVQLLAGNPEVIILDEAEAFLHPPLARKLGSLISKIASDTKKQIFLSTHSPNIIMGSIQSGAKINIIRLSYDGNIGKSTIIDSIKLKEIMSHPLIRSTSFLDALFYKNAIVTESDSDRAFYQEINHRLLKFKPEWGIEDCIFLNAQNKQTVGTIVKQLRYMGVPAASVVDLDFIKEGGTEFTNYLDSVNIPRSLHPTIIVTKETLKSHFKELDDDFLTLKKKGIEALPPELLSAANHLIQTLATYGQYPVPVGELECWLPNVKAYKHGSKWLIKKFESLGFDESAPEYVIPSDNDVWIFLSGIKHWLEDSEKTGMINSQ